MKSLQIAERSEKLAPLCVVDLVVPLLRSIVLYVAEREFSPQQRVLAEVYREFALQMIPASQSVCKELPSRGTRRPYPSVVSSQSNAPYPENEPNGAKAEDFRCFCDLQETRDDEC